MPLAPAPALYAPTAVPAALRPMHAGLAGRDQAVFRAVFIGDSVMEGEGVSVPGYRYMDRFEKLLRNTFATQGVRGSPGSSYLPAYYISASLTDAVQDTTTLLGAGPQTFVVDEQYGLGGRTVRLNYGGALRWDNVECTGIRVHFAKGSFGFAFKVQIDGVDHPSGTSIATNDATTAGGFTSAILPVNPGVHSIRVQTLDNSGFISTIHGIEVFYDDETSGIKCYDGARSGAHTNQFGPMHFASLSASNLGAVHAVFLGLVTNDAVLYNGVIPPDTYRTNLITRMTEIDTVITNDHSIIVMFVPEPNASFGSYTWEQYVAAAKSAVATRSNAYFIDMRDYLGPTVLSDTHGLWADSVHLSRKGNAMVADGMMRSLFLSGGGALEADLPYLIVPAESGTMAPPPAGKLYLYSRDIAGRQGLRSIEPGGVDFSYQPHIGRNNIRQVVPNTGATLATATAALGTVFTNALISTGGVVANPAVSSGSLKTSIKRTTFSTGATAGAGIYHAQNPADLWRGNAARQGGFDFVMVLGIDTMGATPRFFAGLRAAPGTAPTNVDPLTTTAQAKIGLAFNVSTGNWKLVHNDGTAAVTNIDLGATIPVNSTDVLRLTLSCKPNGSNIGYRVENLTTGASVQGTLTTNLPGNTTFLAPMMWLTNNTTAAAFIASLYRWYAESDS